MIGETIGNFKIVSRLGRGGMGEVWLAEQQSIGTKVAIKVLNAAISEDTEHVQRFFNEARAVSRIQHAGITKIFDVGTHAGHAYLIMEYLEGETLSRRIAQTRRLSVTDLSEIGRQVASVLDATHNAGITHRDLKPDNIFIVTDRELSCGYRVKILDFGIAKLTGTLAVVSPRTTGTMGTPAYMAPEQWGDASQVDWRADLYSLGCVSFEMATGRPPFLVTNIAEACAKHLNDPPPHVRELVPDLPLQLDALVDRLLAKSPGARANSMREVERAFGSLPTSQSISLADTLPPVRASKPTVSTDGRISSTVLETAKTRSRGPWTIIALTALVAVAGLMGLAIIKKSHRREIVAVTPPAPADAPPREPVVTPIADAAPPLADAPLSVVADAAVAHTQVAAGSQLPKKKNGTQGKEGKIDAEAVFNVAADDAGLRQCYTDALAGNPTLHGNVSAMIVVDTKGHVTKSSATGVSPGVSRCIARRLEKLDFPPVTEGDYAIVYAPFKFEPPDMTHAPKAAQLKATTVDAPKLSEGLAALKGPLDACDETGNGQGTFEIWINPDGTVKNAKVKGDLAGSSTATCMEKVLIDRGAFGKSTDGIHVTAKFHLSKP